MLEGATEERRETQTSGDDSDGSAGPEAWRIQMPSAVLSGEHFAQCSVKREQERYPFRRLQVAGHPSLC